MIDFAHPAATDAPAIRVERLRELLVNDAGFAFDPQSGLTYTVSPAGLAVIRWLKEGLSAAAIAARVHAEYEVSAPVAAEDCESFFRALEKCRLIERESAGDA